MEVQWVNGQGNKLYACYKQLEVIAYLNDVVLMLYM